MKIVNTMFSLVNGLGRFYKEQINAFDDLPFLMQENEQKLVI